MPIDPEKPKVDFHGLDNFVSSLKQAIPISLD
jgi:hypothetical protein